MEDQVVPETQITEVYFPWSMTFIFFLTLGSTAESLPGEPPSRWAWTGLWQGYRRTGISLEDLSQN